MAVVISKDLRKEIHTNLRSKNARIIDMVKEMYYSRTLRSNLTDERLTAAIQAKIDKKVEELVKL